ncbi:hypothetical protein [Paraliomyxa miuraensis]|uniref:hypothetical protein n=1 Tax=Paraliomyxa miuraensis TaxID=376150 RepID=UPI0022537069|nr:hypothetical protein [Paraliomyxa miuraensis]
MTMNDRHECARAILPVAAMVASLVLGCAPKLVATGETLGTAAQIDLGHGQAASDGSWMVISQSPAVDGPPVRDERSLHDPAAFPLVLLVGDAPGVIIERYWVSPSERHLVVLRSGQLQVVDVAAGTWTELVAWPKGAVGDAEPLPTGPDQAALLGSDPDCFVSFAADGGSVLVPDATPEGPRLVLQQLTDGTRQVIDPGAGGLSWARLMAGGDAVAVGMTVHDGGPAAEAGQWRYEVDAFLSCTGPEEVPDGARNVTRVLRTDGTEVGRRPGDYQPMGASLVRPTPDWGATWWTPAEDRDVEMPSCEGTPLFVDAERSRMLMWCEEPGAELGAGHLRLETPAPDRRMDLGRFEFGSSVAFHDDQGRQVAVHMDGGPLLVDMDTGRLRRLPEGAWVVGIVTDRVLLHHDQSIRRRLRKIRVLDLASLDPVGSFWTRVAIGQLPYGRGPRVMLGPKLVDVSSGTVLGRTSRHPLVVTPEGRVLLLDPQDERRGENLLPRGPLRWFGPAALP